MRHLIQALLFVPLALLASCATSPKFTPEMEALRLSLNQRMANTSSIELTACAMKLENGVVHEHLIKTERMNSTTICPNGDLIIDWRLVSSSGPNKNSLSHSSSEYTTLKVEAKRLKSESASLSDLNIKGDSFGANENYQLATIGNGYDCSLDLPTDYKIMKNHKDPLLLGQKPIISHAPPIATSPDKAFIQGIVHDMNRFIELYKALPK
jgi:hypothetical protein